MEEDPGFLHLIDLSVAGAVASLSCIGCVPFASCSGGLLGGFQDEEHPLVVFFARCEHVPVLLAAAAQVGAGLEKEAATGNLRHQLLVDRCGGEVEAGDLLGQRQLGD